VDRRKVEGVKLPNDSGRVIYMRVWIFGGLDMEVLMKWSQDIPRDLYYVRAHKAIHSKLFTLIMKSSFFRDKLTLK
jgi:hypothetical protein